MSIRGILRPTRCFTSVRRSGLGSHRSSMINNNVFSGQHGLPKVWARGAKRTSTIKANSLPQGVLPALPKLSEEGQEPEKSYPPVLQQHLNNIRKFHDCVVLTRVGDFYEMYFDQVEQYAPLVNLKKAKRATALGDVSMAGFQYGQLDRYLKMFVQDHGLQVAISEQVPLPESERALVKAGSPRFDRKVTRVITAGTLIDEAFVDPFENNFLLGVHVDGAVTGMHGQGAAREQWERATKVGLSWVDLSSGDFYTQSGDLASLSSLVARVGPRELVLDASMEQLGQSALLSMTGDGGYSTHFHVSSAKARSVADWSDLLEVPVPEDEQSAFTSQEVSAGNLILGYIREKLLDTKVQLQPPVRRSDDEYMTVDKQSLRGLEIRSTLRDGLLHGSLLHTIRRTVTKSGARLLSQRMVSPSLSLSIINNRLDLVQEFLYQDALREHITALLRNTFDTFRLLQRFSIGKGDADDMLSLAKTISGMQQISDVLHDHIIANQDQALDNAPEEPSKAPLMELSCFWDILSRFNLDGPMKVAKSIQSTKSSPSSTAPRRRLLIRTLSTSSSSSATSSARTLSIARRSCTARGLSLAVMLS
jgi:DNA mismatch repair ATPase MutS